MKKVTVILPTYNAVRFLSSWFESVAASVNFAQVKILAIDNGSSDGTQELIQSSLRRGVDEFVQNSSNLGVFGSVEKGLSLTSTDYVCYLPADDAMHPEAFEHALEGLDRNSDCVFAFGRSSMRFFSDGSLVGERERVCPYVRPGAYPGEAVRQLFINYPTDVAVVRTESIKRGGGYFAEGIRWNALLQKQGKVFFTGKPCLMSGKYGGNLSGDWAASGKTGANSLKEIGSALCNSKFSEVERFVTLLFASALASGMSVLTVLSQISKDQSDRGFSQFFSVRRDEVLIEVFKVLAGHFAFSRDSLVDKSPPKTHAGNTYCSRDEFFVLRDFLVSRKLSDSLKDRPDTFWAFS
jgi:hypothetical protein